MTAIGLQALVLAQDGWDGHHDMDGGWWIVMMIGMFLFWALIIVAVVWAVRTWSDGNRARDKSTPQDVLERRLAEGQISVEEYEERRRVLSGPTASPGAPESV